MKSRNLSVTINGRAYEISAYPNETLLDLLRYRLGLTGTKKGCDTGHCGSCTVLLDGEAVNSCLVLAVEANGSSVTTIEGLGAGEKLHPLQEAFIASGAIQCGFCTPGMIIAAKYLLDEEPSPTEEDIRFALGGNLCRCTGYVNIIRAVAAAGKAMREGRG